MEAAESFRRTDGLWACDETEEDEEEVEEEEEVTQAKMGGDTVGEEQESVEGTVIECEAALRRDHQLHHSQKSQQSKRHLPRLHQTHQVNLSRDGQPPHIG